MTSISPVNNAALVILQQASSSAASSSPSNGEADIVKLANGVSAEPSNGTKSAAAVAGKFAVDSAPAAGKIHVAGLGSADSWGELEERVRSDETLSEGERKEWLDKLEDLQEKFTAVETFLSSDGFAKIKSGALQSQLAATTAEISERDARHNAINAFAEKHGRGEPFREF